MRSSESLGSGGTESLNHILALLGFPPARKFAPVTRSRAALKSSFAIRRLHHTQNPLYVASRILRRAARRGAMQYPKKRPTPEGRLGWGSIKPRLVA